MPLRRSGAAFKGTIIDVPIGASFGDGTGIFVRISGVQTNNIRLLAVGFYFRRFLRSEFTEYFVQGSQEYRADRTVFQIPFFAASDDIFRLVPLYDFVNLEVWTSKQ